MRKKRNKVSTIYKAFTQDPTVSEQVHEERLLICGQCPYNSKNTDTSSFVDSVRKAAVSAPFCTACKCQIYEKTGQASEECGLSEIGQKPKWNRLIVETKSDNDLDLVNNSPELVSVDLNKEGTAYVVNLGEHKKGDVITFYLSLVYRGDRDFKLTNLRPSCISCTTIKKVVEKDRVNFSVRLDTKNMDGIAKAVNLSYELTSGKRKDVYNNRIKLTGTLTK